MRKQFLYSYIAKGAQTLLFRNIIMLLCVFLSSFIVSCSKEDEPDDKKEYTKEKTIFVYMPWTGSAVNLYNFFENNIDDMKKGIIEQKGLKNTRLLILIANDPNKSHLIEVTYRNGKCYDDTLKTYNGGAMNSPAKMTALLNEIKRISQTPIYSMMIGSHGVGWIYTGSTSRSMLQSIEADRARNKMLGLPITRQTRYFGGSDIQMNIDDLAEGIRNSNMHHLQFLLFDDCYMANIETAYELRNVTDYLIGCPTEIMGHGMPYYEMWKYLVSIQPDYGKAVEGFYNFYSNYVYNGKDCHYGTISVTDCRKVDNMMQVLTAINSRYRIGRNVDSNLQVLDGYVPAAFFDFADYIHKLCAGDANLIRKFDAALLQLIPFERHTAQYYSSLTNNGAHIINTCCGLTISASSTNAMVINSKPRSHFYASLR